MKCHGLNEAIVELARGEHLGAGTVAAVETHVEQCAACRARLARERQLSEGLRALAASTVADVPSERVRRRLLEAFAERQVTKSSASTGRRYRWMQAAAAVVLGIGAVASWFMLGAARPPESLTTSTSAVAAGPAVVSQQGGQVIKDAASPPRTPDRAQQRRPHVQRVKATHVIRPEGFVPLPAALGLPDFESGEIVRMEIPLTSLPVYGLEIPPDAHVAPVEADLLVGQDGQPRAIRLVKHADSGNSGGR